MKAHELLTSFEAWCQESPAEDENFPEEILVSFTVETSFSGVVRSVKTLIFIRALAANPTARLPCPIDRRPCRDHGAQHQHFHHASDCHRLDDLQARSRAPRRWL
jgi:hypothetical protein